MEIQKFSTLEGLLQRFNPNLFIEEIKSDPPSPVDRLMVRTAIGPQFVCSVPPGGKYKSWLSMIAEVHKDSDTLSVGGQVSQHRSLDALILKLIKKGLIKWSDSKRFFGSSDLMTRVDKHL